MQQGWKTGGRNFMLKSTYSMSWSASGFQRRKSMPTPVVVRLQMDV
jgi:hypothetical protein